MTSDVCTLRKGEKPKSPPRLLGGATLLFWGGVTGHPIVGLICALLVEGRSWINLRWNFGERGFVRSWYLAFSLGLLTLAWFWLQGTSQVLLFDVLVWMPVYFIPVVLAQNYATEASMALNTFSFIARRKMLADRKAGRRVDPIQIHVGYPYLCLVVVASALSRIDEMAFFAGLIFLAACTLVFSSPLRSLRPWGMGVALVLVALLGAFGSAGLRSLWTSLDRVFTAPSGSYTLGDRSQTAIGQLGTIKQSRRIRWRVYSPGQGVPSLLREAVYNHYNRGQWWHRPVRRRDGARARGGPASDLEVSGAGEIDKRERDYESLWDRKLADGRLQFAFEIAEFDRDPALLRDLRVKGKVSTKTPLPLPPSTRLLSGFQVTDGGIDANSLGTVRLENPDHGVISFEAYAGGRSLHEELPDPLLDLQVPLSERMPGNLKKNEIWMPDGREGIRSICDRWGLRGLSAGKATKIIKERFLNGFTYSLHRRNKRAGKSSAVAEFLTGRDGESRVGHCEYFATAAVLLLREAGIPARYCVGYSAQEQARDGEWLLRGSHAHAWVRVWHGEIPPDEIPEGVDPASFGSWKDFDPTTPQWFALEGAGSSNWSRQILDWWQKTREDLLLWRTSPGNGQRINWTIIATTLLLLSYLVVRLWQSRTRRRGMRMGWTKGPETRRTPLHGLARLAERPLGRRDENVAFTEWILGLCELMPADEADLRRAVSYHWKARFDPIGLEAGEEDRFADLCARLREEIRRVPARK